jgi:hypothetical protein
MAAIDDAGRPVDPIRGVQTTQQRAMDPPEHPADCHAATCDARSAALKFLTG